MPAKGWKKADHAPRHAPTAATVPAATVPPVSGLTPRSRGQESTSATVTLHADVIETHFQVLAGALQQVTTLLEQLCHTMGNGTGPSLRPDQYADIPPRPDAEEAYPLDGEREYPIVPPAVPVVVHEDGSDPGPPPVPDFFLMDADELEDANEEYELGLTLRTVRPLTKKQQACHDRYCELYDTDEPDASATDDGLDTAPAAPAFEEMGLAELKQAVTQYHLAVDLTDPQYRGLLGKQQAVQDAWDAVYGGGDAVSTPTTGPDEEDDTPSNW
jgi:hypothetical protein